MNKQHSEIERTEAQLLSEVLSSIRNVISQSSNESHNIKSSIQEDDDVFVLTEVATITHDSPHSTSSNNNILNNLNGNIYNSSLNINRDSEVNNNMSANYKINNDSTDEERNTTVLPINNKKISQKHDDHLIYDNKLVSETTAIKVESTVQKLKDIMKDNSQEMHVSLSEDRGKTIEEIATNLLEKRLACWLDHNLASMATDSLNHKLSQWLNENLHIMVDKIVREEIQKLLKTSDKQKRSNE